ncbi:MAG: glutamate synthase central domain-containing protein, partial [Clostridia bacterium]
MKKFTEQKNTIGLYDPRFEHDNCGIGAVVDIKGRQTHKTVSDALHIVENLEHRAGKDAKGETGDGVGILLQVSHKFFSKVATEMSIDIGAEREYGVGMFFFPQDEHILKQIMKMFEIITEKEGLEFVAWRKVPTAPEILGEKAIECMPNIWQCFIKKPKKLASGIDFDRRLYVVRRVFEQSQGAESYVCSLSSRTIVYKGMFLVEELRRFYLDLQDEDYESALGMVHSRFSTNTTPSWMRAHPNRFILHNGEINTIRGNADLMLAREEKMTNKYLKNDMTKVVPIVNQEGSDSAMLDNALEFMVMSGLELPLSVMATIPEPWANNDSMSRTKKDFYQYYATMLEPWDGPASILFSDGDIMGAVLDRNGLRPSRYYITKDGRMILSSEVGVVDIDESEILQKDRLRPGKMLLVDLKKGELIADDDLKESYATRKPYGEWLDKNLVKLRELKIPNVAIQTYSDNELLRLQKAFGYRYEDVSSTILAMASKGTEPYGAMGDDTPLAALSDRHPSLFNYFKQMFAQVTNPPIDAIREKVVTDTSIYIGARGNLLEEKAENCKVLKVKNPILTESDLIKIKHMNKKGFNVVTVPTTYYKNTSLEKAIERLFVEINKAHHDGANIVILSDRGVDEYHVAIPSLLAVSAISKYLVRTKKRTSLALIVETAEPRDVHHFATLLGYGACAINPYLAHRTIDQLIKQGLIKKDFYAAVNDYNLSVIEGIVKIASKMGISTI